MAEVKSEVEDKFIFTLRVFSKTHRLGFEKTNYILKYINKYIFFWFSGDEIQIYLNCQPPI